MLTVLWAELSDKRKEKLPGLSLVNIKLINTPYTPYIKSGSGSNFLHLNQ